MTCNRLLMLLLFFRGFERAKDLHFVGTRQHLLQNISWLLGRGLIHPAGENAPPDDWPADMVEYTTTERGDKLVHATLGLLSELKT
jgi:hypothetical protein